MAFVYFLGLFFPELEDLGQGFHLTTLVTLGTIFDLILSNSALISAIS